MLEKEKLSQYTKENSRLVVQLQKQKNLELELE